MDYWITTLGIMEHETFLGLRIRNLGLSWRPCHLIWLFCLEFLRFTSRHWVACLFLCAGFCDYILCLVITWAWNIKMRWDQKGWLKYTSSFLNSPRTHPKVQNWKSYALLKLDFFAKLPKVNHVQNFKFCQMGPFFFTCFEFAL